MICEKIFCFVGRSAEYARQAALSLIVCLAPNHMVTPFGTVKLKELPFR